MAYKSGPKAEPCGTPYLFSESETSIRLLDVQQSSLHKGP